MNSEELLNEVYNAVIDGNKRGAIAAAEQALAAQVAPEVILNEACIPAMSEVGSMFETGEAFVREMLIAARAMQGVVDILRPQLLQSGAKPVATVVLGTVAGDMHDIGKNLVGMMLEGNGFAIVDLGVDVTPAKFVAAVEEHKPALVGMSALLTTTMPGIKTTIDALEKAGLRGGVKVMVGGAPVTEEFARAIGADGFAPDAGGAARHARALLGLA